MSYPCLSNTSPSVVVAGCSVFVVGVGCGVGLYVIGLSSIGI
jgi:hypothetical protein